MQHSARHDDAADTAPATAAAVLLDAASPSCSTGAAPLLPPAAAAATAPALASASACSSSCPGVSSASPPAPPPRPPSPAAAAPARPRRRARYCSRAASRRAAFSSVQALGKVNAMDDHMRTARQWHKITAYVVRCQPSNARCPYPQSLALSDYPTCLTGGGAAKQSGGCRCPHLHIHLDLPPAASRSFCDSPRHTGWLAAQHAQQLSQSHSRDATAPPAPEAHCAASRPHTPHTVEVAETAGGPAAGAGEGDAAC